MTGNALSTVEEATTFGQRFKLAELLCSTGFLPASIKTPAQALAIIETGRELGIPPMHALRSIQIIQGKPSLSAELQMALFKRKGGRSEWLEASDTRAAVKLTHPNGDTYTAEFTFAEAQAAGITSKDGWKNYRRAMLRARVISSGLRVVAPDIVAGMYDPEEMGADIGPGGEIVVSGTVEESEAPTSQDGPTEKQVTLFAKLLKSHVWTDEEREGYRDTGNTSRA